MFKNINVEIKTMSQNLPIRRLKLQAFSNNQRGCKVSSLKHVGLIFQHLKVVQTLYMQSR